MPNVYVEPRPKGRPEGSHIDDFVVEDHADHILASFRTQREAIQEEAGSLAVGLSLGGLPPR